MTTKQTSEQEYLETLRRVAQDYPEFAGKFALVKVEKSTSAVPEASAVTESAVTGKRGTQKVRAVSKAEKELECLEWGTDPKTGERVCNRQLL